MPLIASTIDQARTAYAALETRALSAEAHVATLQASMQTLTSVVPVIMQNNGVLSQYATQQLQTNAQLTSDQATAVAPDTPLAGFVASLGLAAALAEATMPDRTVTSLASTIQSYLSFTAQPDGSLSIGLRLYQPEFGTPSALATTSFEIAKIPPQAGAVPPPNLYLVLADMQNAFGDSFWAGFTSGSPAVSPAWQIVAECTKMLSNVAAWTLPFLIAESVIIAEYQSKLVTLVQAGSQSATAAPFAAAVSALSALNQRLSSVSAPVAGDLFALATALDLTTKTAALIG